MSRTVVLLVMGFAAICTVGLDRFARAGENDGLTEESILGVLKEKKEFAPADGSFRIKVSSVSGNSLFGFEMNVQQGKDAVSKITGNGVKLKFDAKKGVIILAIEKGEAVTKEGTITFQDQEFELPVGRRKQ